MLRILLFTVALFASGPALAADQVSQQAAAAIETHATSNALDGPLARADVYTLLRGGLSWKSAHDGGETAVEFAAQTTAYRRHAIEDDRGASLTLSRRERFGRFELRGAASLSVASEGDDLAIGGTILGIRTDKAIVAGELEAGVDLGSGFALLGSLSHAVENAGRTRIEGLDLPLRLEPDATRLRAAVGLRRTGKAWTVALTGRYGETAYERLGDPPVSVSSRDLLAQAELRWTAANGAAIGGSLGVARLTAANGLYDRARPVWALALRLPFAGGHAIEASGGGGFETVDTDDPLASYLTRGEIELSLALRERVTLGLGVYGEVKENLLLENEEHAEGFYAEIAWAPTPRASILFRLDHRDEFATVYDTRTVTWDAFVRLSLKR